MNYQRIYNEIIERAKKRPNGSVDGEVHHILPASMCTMSKRYGERPHALFDTHADSLDNLVLLTYREHYLAHWLLFKIHRNMETSLGWLSMSRDKSGNRYTSASYKYLKSSIVSPRIGMRHSDATKALISRNTSKGMKGLVQSSAHVENKAKTKRKAVVATSLDGSCTLEFKCARDASSLGFKTGAISRCCNGKNKTHGGYTWAFARQD